MDSYICFHEIPSGPICSIDQPSRRFRAVLFHRPGASVHSTLSSKRFVRSRSPRIHNTSREPGGLTVQQIPTEI